MDMGVLTDADLRAKSLNHNVHGAVQWMMQMQWIDEDEWNYSIAGGVVFSEWLRRGVGVAYRMGV